MNKNRGRCVIKPFLHQYGGYHYESNWFHNLTEREEREKTKKKNVICDATAVKA